MTTERTAEEVARPDLTDPNVVHVNILRGTIAKPTWAQIKHLYPRISELEEALTKIANGEGYYGAQAREYKQIARAALQDGECELCQTCGKPGSPHCRECRENGND